MISMAIFMVGMGCVLMVLGYFSAKQDRFLMYSMNKEAELDSFKVRRGFVSRESRYNVDGKIQSTLCARFRWRFSHGRRNP